jgi:glycerate-2-kinase
MPCPEPPLTLDDLITVTKVMTRVGATYADLNVVRKNLENIKGGKLIDIAAPAQVAGVDFLDFWTFSFVN